MNNSERVEIATKLAQLYQNYDPYQFGDTFDDEAQAIAHTEEMLMHEYETQSIIELCNDILVSDSEELYEETLAIKNELMKLKFTHEVFSEMGMPASNN